MVIKTWPFVIVGVTVNLYTVSESPSGSGKVCVTLPVAPRGKIVAATSLRESNPWIGSLNVMVNSIGVALGIMVDLLMGGLLVISVMVG